jgi:bifunctional ADP-heptose synthase (sugar kinase/adenylyltransferase)
MLNDFVDGSGPWISPEAQAPVLPARRTEFDICGADGRPVRDERTRSDALGALEEVDLVAVIRKTDRRPLIAQTRPNVLIRDGDHACKRVAGHRIVECPEGAILQVEVFLGSGAKPLVNCTRGDTA